jgi:hypothetical protein
MRKDANPKLVALLGKVFDDANSSLRKELGAAEYERRRYDFVFHMTDWVGDMEELCGLYQHPEKPSLKTATQTVISCLYHVIPHIREAGRLLLDYDPVDVFAGSSPRKTRSARKQLEPKRSRTAAR